MYSRNIYIFLYFFFRCGFPSCPFFLAPSFSGRLREESCVEYFGGRTGHAPLALEEEEEEEEEAAFKCQDSKFSLPPSLHLSRLSVRGQRSGGASKPGGLFVLNPYPTLFALSCSVANPSEKKLSQFFIKKVPQNFEMCALQNEGYFRRW